MADINKLSDLIRQSSFYSAGGKDVDSLDKVNTVLDTANKGISGYQEILNNVLKQKSERLAQKKSGLDIGQAEYEQTEPQRDLGNRLTEAKITNLLETKPQATMKRGVHRIIDRKTGKILQEFLASEGTGDTITEVGESPTSGFREKNFESGLRKEFINRPEVKDFVAVNTQIKSMDAMLGSALQGNQQNQLALDQALITMYNKLTDPQSVVRESEYARTPENLPVVNRIQGAIEKVKQGGAGMTNDDRQALVQGAKIIGKERGRTFQNTRNEYSNLAGMYQIDPRMITSTVPEFKEDQFSTSVSTGTQPTGALTPDKEARYQELMKKKQEGTLK